MNSSEFDQRFEAGDSVLEALDLTRWLQTATPC